MGCRFTGFREWDGGTRASDAAHQNILDAQKQGRCIDRACSPCAQVIANRHCAFVTYAERAAAERAVDELQHKLIVRGQRCKLMWGKPQEKRPSIEGRDPAGADMLPSGPPPTAMIPPQVWRLF